MRINPSEKCPCGSKKSYRDCCKRTRDRNRIITFIVVFALAILFAKVMFREEPAPPPGKVWSEEHGHYHDVNAPAGNPAQGGTPSGPQGTLPGQSGQNVPEPAGQAPPGKVWSPEHGHYHDVIPQAGTSTQGGTVPGQPAQNVPQPEGPVPPGKVWSPEHGHWHDVR